MTRLTHLLISLSLALFLVGCPLKSADSAGPVDTCEEPGQRCKLGGGQLGVCSADPDGQLECVSQH
ncbi:MAG: hypothetical protein ACOCV2_08370 [Persicimonas sp.]